MSSITLDSTTDSNLKYHVEASDLATLGRLAGQQGLDGSIILDGTLTGNDVANASLPASVLFNGAGGEFASIPLTPTVSPDGATLLSLDLDAPSGGIVIAAASGYAVPLGGTVLVTCEIRLAGADSNVEMRFDALNGASNPFGGIRPSRWSIPVR